MDVDPYGIEANAPQNGQHEYSYSSGSPVKWRISLSRRCWQSAVTPRGEGAVACSIEKTDLILIGTLKQIRRFIEKISFQHSA